MFFILLRVENVLPAYAVVLGLVAIILANLYTFSDLSLVYLNSCTYLNISKICLSLNSAEL